MVFKLGVDISSALTQDLHLELERSQRPRVLMEANMRTRLLEVTVVTGADDASSRFSMKG